MKKQGLEIRDYYACESRLEADESERMCNWSEKLSGQLPAHDQNGNATCPCCGRAAKTEPWIVN